MKKYGRLVFWIILFVLFNLAIFAMYKSKIPTEQNSHVIFSNNTKLDVWIANSSPSKTKWLMFVKSMPEDRGMIFVYEPDRVANFWMKNTLIPLDMIFVWSDMEIKTIHTWAIPMDESLISSKVPVKYVIETNSWYVDRYGIMTGMKIDITSFPKDIDINLSSGWQDGITTDTKNQ